MAKRDWYFSRLLVTAACGAVFCTASAAELTPEQAKRDAGILVETLRTLHPALDKYSPPAMVEANFQRFTSRAHAARSPAEMYLAATELAASVRCGHTWTNVLNQQGAIKAQLLEAPDKLPVTLALVEGRWLVLGSMAAGIHPGDELISIDRQPASAVIARMMPYLRADGASDGKRLRQLSHGRDDYSMMDIVWPLISPPSNGHYQLEIARSGVANRVIAAPAVTLAARTTSLAQQGIKPASAEWSLRIDGNRAIMTLPTFSVYRSKLNWKSFFAENFAALRRSKAEHLIIDIRANEGGDGAIVLDLLSYLVKQPATYVADQSVTMYERVPYKLARYLDTWDYGFFDRTGLVDPITDGPQAGRLRFRPNANKTVVIIPQENRFQGRVWLLIGPENSSATFALAKLAKQLGAATLVGQASGGNQRGLNGGQLAWVNLPHSGVAVDVPLLAASYQVDTPDASVAPDIVVAPRFKQRAAGHDEEMEAVMKASR